MHPIVGKDPRFLSLLRRMELESSPDEIVATGN